jgi:hypothetical protein
MYNKKSSLKSASLKYEFLEMKNKYMFTNP